MFLTFLPPILATDPPQLYESFPFAVGFSLRKIRRGYTGPCITVRRSSDSAEQDIGFASSGIVDVTAIASFCGAGSGFIRRWFDQSPSANHAVQTTASLQPRIYNAGTQEVNELGKPTIRFIDGTAAGIGLHLLFSPWHAASAAYIGLFATYSMASDGFYPQLLNSSPPDRGIAVTHFEATRQVRCGSIRTGGNSFANGSALTLNQTYVAHSCADRSRVKGFLDKSASPVIDIADSDTDFSMPTNYIIGGIAIAGTVTQDMRISSLIGYNTNISADNLTIRSDLFDYWRS